MGWKKEGREVSTLFAGGVVLVGEDMVVMVVERVRCKVKGECYRVIMWCCVYVMGGKRRRRGTDRLYRRPSDAIKGCIDAD